MTILDAQHETIINQKFEMIINMIIDIEMDVGVGVETKCVTLRKVEPFEWCEKRINNIDKCLYCDWKPMRAYELSQIRE